ncbi:hypothetical protein RN001_010125 [Aquatica leii]|uniref:CSD domain-containing protein n=1 Tax=Aquatica leii TaxID=1421715 RepID=A0AAN7SFX7_9COLE|nr:hypothetical protein RN001_010125 [Aquatica leii]
MYHQKSSGYKKIFNDFNCFLLQSSMSRTSSSVILSLSKNNTSLNGTLVKRDTTAKLTRISSFVIRKILIFSTKTCCVIWRHSSITRRRHSSRDFLLQNLTSGLNNIMAETEQAPEQDKATAQRNGYGFMNRNNTKEDLFVHQSAIIKNNPKKTVRPVGDRDVVEFSVVVSEMGQQISPYAADDRRGYRQWYYPPQSRGAGRQGLRRPPRKDFASNEEEGKDSSEVVDGGDPPRRYRSNRERGGYRTVGGGGIVVDTTVLTVDLLVPTKKGGSRNRRSPKRFFRKNFRGGRSGGGSRSRSPHGQGQGEQSGDKGTRGSQRLRYRRRGAQRPST